MSLFTHRRWPALSALATVLAVLPSCGGGGSSTPAPVPTPSFTIFGDTARDGFVAGDGYAVANADSAGAVPSTTGDNGLVTPATRQFFSFDLSTLPAGATVQSATLRVLQQAVAGTPYTTHGVVIVDHLVYDVLDGSDFDVAALTANIGTLSTTATLEVKTLVVTTQVLADLAAARTHSQFRVRWSVADDDGDVQADAARFTDAEDLSATGSLPQIVVTYTLP